MKEKKWMNESEKEKNKRKSREEPKAQWLIICQGLWWPNVFFLRKQNDLSQKL